MNLPPTLIFHASGISCEHCRSAITDSIERLEGIQDVQVDLGSKQVTVRGPALNADLILETLERIGYPPVPA